MRPLLLNRVDDARLDDNSIIPDLAANEQENASSEIVRRHFLTPTPKPRVSAAERRSVTSDNLSQAEGEELQHRAPVVPEQRSRQVVSYYALQEWEGHVTAIGSENFVAELIDVTRAAPLPSEQVELPLADLGHEQREALKLGAVFRWTIGYETAPSGQKRRVSQLMFRQLPQWTKADLDAAERRAGARQRDIRWE